MRVGCDPVATTIAAYNDPRYIESYVKRAALTARVVETGTFYKRVTQLHGPKAMVLEAGCAQGRDLAALLNFGLRTVGIDVSKCLLEAARETLKVSGLFAPGMLDCADLRHLPFPNASFQGIYSRATLLHFPYDEAVNILNEFYRVSSPDAVIHIRVREGKGEQFEYVWPCDPNNDLQRFYKYWEPQEIASLMSATGFTNVEVIRSVDDQAHIKPERKDIAWLNVWAMK